MTIVQLTPTKFINIDHITKITTSEMVQCQIYNNEKTYNTIGVIPIEIHLQGLDDIIYMFVDTIDTLYLLIKNYDSYNYHIRKSSDIKGVCVSRIAIGKDNIYYELSDNMPYDNSISYEYYFFKNTSLSHEEIIKKTYPSCEVPEETIKKTETEYYYDGPEGSIVVPMTIKSQLYWSRNTKWWGCNYNKFEHYDQNGKKFIIIDKKNNKKYMLQFETEMFFDEYNIQYDFISYIDENDWVIKSLFPYIINSSKASLWYSKKILKCKFPEGEKAISGDIKTSLSYAIDVLNGPFINGEKIISTDPCASYHYASNVLKGNFYLGENSIAKDAYYATEYAINVLKQEFPLGENSIKNDHKHWMKYSMFFRKI